MSNTWNDERFLQQMRDLLRRAAQEPERKAQLTQEAVAINCLELALETQPALSVVRN